MADNETPVDNKVDLQLQDITQTTRTKRYMKRVSKRGRIQHLRRGDRHRLAKKGIDERVSSSHLSSAGLNVQVSSLKP